MMPARKAEIGAMKFAGVSRLPALKPQARIIQTRRVPQYPGVSAHSVKRKTMGFRFWPYLFLELK